MDAPPRISVVVPAFQAAATIDACLRALAQQTVARDQYEVIVVDDASTDDTAAVAAEAGARVLRLARNSGPSGARNAGVAAARGETIVFTDADCEPTPSFLAALTGRLRDPRVGGAKGVYLSKQRALVARFVQYEYEQRYRHTARQRCVDFADTYALCLRRADIMRVGGFDPRLRVCEDQELSFRLAAAGVHIEFAPDARTYHRHCEQLWAYVRKKVRIARWKVRVLHRHPGRALHDSHTPQLLKLEIVVAHGLCLTAVLYGVLHRRERAWVPLAITLSTYLGVIAPFVVACARRDLAVALAAPAILVGRDLALGAGLALGLLEVLTRQLRPANGTALQAGAGRSRHRPCGTCVIPPWWRLVAGDLTWRGAVDFVRRVDG